MSSGASNGTRRGGRRASGGDSGGGSRAAEGGGGANDATSPNNCDPDDLAGGGEGSNNGSTTTEGGGGSAADEPGMTRKRRRMANRASRGPPQKSVHATQADSERWFTNTHLAMVVILAALYSDLQERHLQSHDEDYKDAEEVWEGYMQRIKDIGQEANAFTKSRVQTHLLISNTVQLCHRMAADKNCRLAKDYPSGHTSDFEYDFSTDFDTDEEDGEEGDPSTGSSAKHGGRDANGGGVSNGKAKKVKENGDGGDWAGGASDKHHRGSVRERYEALVLSLVERARWNAERSGRPRKDVITRAREVVMAIFIDSYYRKMLSREMLDDTLENLERIIALADAAGEGEEAEAKLDLGDGLPLSKIGLANIALTPPE